MTTNSKTWLLASGLFGLMSLATPDQAQAKPSKEETAEMLKQCRGIDLNDAGKDYDKGLNNFLSVNVGGALGGSSTLGLGLEKGGGMVGYVGLADRLSVDWNLRAASFKNKDGSEMKYFGRASINFASREQYREIYADGWVGSTGNNRAWTDYYCKNIQHARSNGGYGLALQYDSYTQRPAFGLSYSDVIGRSKTDMTEYGNWSLLYFVGTGFGGTWTVDRLWSGTDGLGIGWGGNVDLNFNKYDDKWVAVFMLGVHGTLGVTNLF